MYILKSENVILPTAGEVKRFFVASGGDRVCIHRPFSLSSILFIKNNGINCGVNNHAN